MKIARRNFLSMLAAVPFMSSCKNPTSEPPPQPTNLSKNFCVWIHGIFGITFQSSQILLISPKLVESNNRHIYKVGRATGYDKKNNAYTGTQDLKDAGTYLIDGLGPLTGPTTIFPSDFRDNALLTTGTAKSNWANTFYFVLPYPKYLWPLRPFKTKVVPGTSCPGRPGPRTGNVPQGGDVPLTHVFEYENVPYNQVKIIQGSVGGQVIWGPGQSAHLHIYAEPDPSCYPKCHDPRASFKALQDCYDGIPQFIVCNDQLDCPLLNNVRSLKCDLTEQFGLFEWNDQCQESPHIYSPEHPQATRGTMDCPQQLVSENVITFTRFKCEKKLFDQEQKAFRAEYEKNRM